MEFINNLRTYLFSMLKFFFIASLTIHAGEEVDAKSAESSMDMSALIMKYAPELREHPDEKFPAVNAQWIWERAGIMYNGQIIVPPGKIPSTDLNRILVKVNGNDEPIMRTSQSQDLIKGLTLIIPEEFYGAQDKGRKGQPLCYAHARPSLRGKAIDISYIFFNAYNGTPSSGIPGVTTVLKKLGVGHHEGDIEHITVRLLRESEKIMGVLYARHGSKEYQWYTSQGKSMDSDDGYKMNGNQIITWSARDTHGNNNKAGTLKRTPPIYLAEFVKMIGVLVEKTSDGGRKINCRNNLVILPSVVIPAPKPFEWMNFRGKWGRPKPPSAPKGGEGPPGIPYKHWWDEEPEGPQ